MTFAFENSYYVMRSIKRRFPVYVDCLIIPYVCLANPKGPAGRLQTQAWTTPLNFIHIQVTKRPERARRSLMWNKWESCDLATLSSGGDFRLCDTHKKTHIYIYIYIYISQDAKFVRNEVSAFQFLNNYSALSLDFLTFCCGSAFQTFSKSSFFFCYKKINLSSIK